MHEGSIKRSSILYRYKNVKQASLIFNEQQLTYSVHVPTRSYKLKVAFNCETDVAPEVAKSDKRKLFARKIEKHKIKKKL